jgi:ubiquinone/menaquinone biosynthesis C-methylase UbiE
MGDRLPEEIRNHYRIEIREDLRLREGLGRLEFLRTQEVVRRHLPRPGLRILDVGGGTGVHAEWLLADGHQVHLIDPVVSHVTHASERLGELSGFSAEAGDARALTVDDASFDVVLLFGPLYHLTERSDRLGAWREAVRVIGPTGLVFGMGITRFASLLDGLAQGFLFDDGFRGIVERDLATGQHRNPTRQPGWFTTAYFHHPHELVREAEEAGLHVREVLGVEGLAGWLPSLGERWDNPSDRETILFSARAIESEPALQGLSPHLIAVTEPSTDQQPASNNSRGHRA